MMIPCASAMISRVRSAPCTRAAIWSSVTFAPATVRMAEASVANNPASSWSILQMQSRFESRY